MYTEWPKEAFPSESTRFVFGILGKDPFGKDIDIIKGETLKGRNIIVKPLANLQEATGCHLLFIGSSEKHRLPEILKALGSSSVLTVSEIDGFRERGGMLQVSAETGSWNANQEAITKAGLKMDSQLRNMLAKAGKS